MQSRRLWMGRSGLLPTVPYRLWKMGQLSWPRFREVCVPSALADREHLGSLQ